MLIRLFLLFIITVLLVSCSESDKYSTAKFSHNMDTPLLFIGQDNESVGGNDRFNDGYVNHIGVPAGVTHYIGFRENDKGPYIEGLNKEFDWNAGPMCLKYYLESEKLKNCIIHLSIDMVGYEDKVADGKMDILISELCDFIKKYNDRPFIVRIGYEFDGDWNHYEAEPFKKAFRRIVDYFRANNLSNFATCMAATSFVVDYKLWEKYYPGDDYVDWCGYSYWEGDPPNDASSLKFSRDHSKPVFIAEISPRGHFIPEENQQVLWNTWYKTLLEHIELNKDVVKAISYINCNWEAQPMWKGQKWGDSRIQSAEHIKKKWIELLETKRFINGSKEVFNIIGFGI